MKNIRTILVMLLFSCVGGLVACGQADPPLQDTVWVLESYGEQGNFNTTLADTEVTVTFKGSDGQITGSAGCNNYGSGYVLDGNKLSLPGPLISTMMSCGDAIDRQEQQYLAALQSAESYTIKDGKLTIQCAGAILVFTQK